uniref:tripartite tricarboxylate transporter TctB family protein n=1 Tax=Pelomicrobium sp. TaxID=2815319 RepID=UPI002FDE9823
LLFGALVRGAGLVPATAVLVLVSAYASVYFRWFPSLALAAGLTLFCALVFVYALGLPLPLLGPWLGG